MNDPYTRVPWSNRPLSCDLVDITTGKIVLCRLLTWDTLKRTFPGQVETLNGTKVVIDNIGPLSATLRFDHKPLDFSPPTSYNTPYGPIVETAHEN